MDKFLIDTACKIFYLRTAILIFSHTRIQSANIWKSKLHKKILILGTPRPRVPTGVDSPLLPAQPTLSPGFLQLLTGWDGFRWGTEDDKRQVECKQQLLYNGLKDFYHVLMSKYLPFWNNYFIVCGSGLVHPGTANKHINIKVTLPGSCPCSFLKLNFCYGCSPSQVKKPELGSKTHHDLLH